MDNYGRRFMRPPVSAKGGIVLVSRVANRSVMRDHPQIEIRFHDDEIEFCSYYYPPASVYPSAKIAGSDIREIDPDCAPPEVRIEGEILFVPATMREELRRFAHRHSIPIVKRIDVWDLLLEPFLDTEFNEDQQKRTLDTLEECRISRDESEVIRRFVADAMMAYNFTSALWEWVHLGLFDALEAFRGVLSGRLYRLAPREYREFYWRAMEIAGRGMITGRGNNEE